MPYIMWCNHGQGHSPYASMHKNAIITVCPRHATRSLFGRHSEIAEILWPPRVRNIFLHFSLLLFPGKSWTAKKKGPRGRAANFLTGGVLAWLLVCVSLKLPTPKTPSFFPLINAVLYPSTPHFDSFVRFVELQKEAAVTGAGRIRYPSSLSG